MDINRKKENFCTRFAQGSIWMWEMPCDRRAGVQGGTRPVLIISNNQFNQCSPSVNCLTITSVLKDSPVHVPVYIERDSHIQCEQVHTVPKNELIRLCCMLDDDSMLEVKRKIRLQYDMGENETMAALGHLNRRVDAMRQNLRVESKASISDEFRRLEDHVLYAQTIALQRLEKALTNRLADMADELRKPEGVGSYTSGQKHLSPGNYHFQEVITHSGTEQILM